MSALTKGFAACERGDRYIQQLVKHWSHKFETAYADGQGMVPFSETTKAQFYSTDDGIAIRLETANAEEGERMRGVIERHLDRFAFREAPLDYRWSDI